MIRLTYHAREALERRGIALGWIEAAIAAPDRAGPDPHHPDRTRAITSVPEFGRRVLRVVHRPEGADVVVITAHFDRGVKR